MDANNFEYVIKDLKFKLLSGDCSFKEINQLLQHIVINKIENHEEVRALLLILENYKDELPFFSKMCMDLINKQFLFNNIINSCQEGAEVSSCCDKESSSVNSVINSEPTHQNPQIGNPGGGGLPKDMTPEYIASTAGLKHKEVIKVPSMNEKTIITYEHMADGTLKEVNRETVQEPNIEDLFANILGNEMKENPIQGLQLN